MSRAPGKPAVGKPAVGKPAPGKPAVGNQSNNPMIPQELTHA